MSYFTNPENYTVKILCTVEGNTIQKAQSLAPQGTEKVMIQGSNYVALIPKK